MSNFNGKYVSAAEHFGGKGIDVTVQGRHETVRITAHVDHAGKVVVEKAVVDHTHRDHHH